MRIILFLFLLTGCVREYVAHYDLYKGDTYVTIGSNKLHWKMDVQFLPHITMVHIHCEPSGAIGVTFNPPPNIGWDKLSGEESNPDVGNKCGWVTFDDLEKDIKLGKAYVNIHTVSHPAGRTRATLEKK